MDKTTVSKIVDMVRVPLLPPMGKWPSVMASHC